MRINRRGEQRGTTARIFKVLDERFTVYPVKPLRGGPGKLAKSIKTRR